MNTKMPDPFEKMIRVEKLEEELFKSKCLKATEKMATEIKNVDSPIHKLISDTMSIKANKDKTMTFTDFDFVLDPLYVKYPIVYTDQLDTLTKCFVNYDKDTSTRNKLNKKFDRLSKYLKVEGVYVYSDLYKQKSKRFGLNITRNN